MNGLAHDQDERSRVANVVLGTEVLYAVVRRLPRRVSSRRDLTRVAETLAGASRSSEV